ncbi:MAG: hypothetical protein OHK0019_13240 [Saprospiraceae bacterium]
MTDGKPDEWTNFRTKDALDYAVANDAENLYLCVRSSDRANTMKIMRNGLRIWFDPTGGEAKTREIVFPVPGSDAAAMPEMRPGQRPDEKAMRDRFRASKKYLSAVGFDGMTSQPTDDYQAFGIRAAADWDDRNALTLELAIPFKLLDWQLPLAQPAGIGFVLEALPAPSGDGMPGGRFPGRAGGGGVPPGGFPGGGMPGGGGDFQRMFEEMSFWIKVTLASK